MENEVLPTSEELARAAGYSRAQFYRRFVREASEPPIRIRRRLLLERAAYEVSQTRKSVTEIAFDAGFASLEGFARAFRTAYGLSARRFRALGVGEYRFDLTERVHFHPGTPRQGEPAMDMTRTLIADHFDRVESLVASLRSLPADQLEAPLVSIPGAFPWMPAPSTLLQLLDNCYQQEPWLSTINEERFEQTDRSLDAYLARLRWGKERFSTLVDTIERENLWDLTFVDKECTPPEVFSYGFIVNFTITYNIYHRIALEGKLREMGATG